MSSRCGICRQPRVCEPQLPDTYYYQGLVYQRVSDSKSANALMQEYLAKFDESSSHPQPTSVPVESLYPFIATRECRKGVVLTVLGKDIEAQQAAFDRCYAALGDTSAAEERPKYEGIVKDAKSHPKWGPMLW